jgi:glutamine amidotransferase
MPVGIIDYKLGNLTSVYNAIGYIGEDPLIIEDPKDFSKVGHVILPGVGAFGVGIQNLKTLGFIEAINTHAVVQQKPFLGICLGMHLLSQKGSEHGDAEGLGMIPGHVERLDPSDKSLKVPHIGWSNIEHRGLKKTYDHLEEADYYFAHSYRFVPDDEDVISSVCDYGGHFVSSVENDNIWGIQFHPEKSQKFGLAVLKNFAKI